MWKIFLLFSPSFSCVLKLNSSYVTAYCSSNPDMYQVEMAEIRSIVSGATEKTLVLVDEICRVTETAKGTCIAGSIVENLDAIGCLRIISTHLHGIFSLPLCTKNTVHKAMGTVYVDGQPKPTWKLMDSICRESLAFETAKREGIPESIIERAEGLYNSVYASEVVGGKIDRNLEEFCSTGFTNFDRCSPQSSSTRVEAVVETGLVNDMEVLQEEVESVITLICQKKLVELDNENTSGLTDIQCVQINVREQPPPSTVGASCVYVIFRPDSKLYVGQTDDLEGRVRTHRSKEGMRKAYFLYFTVPGKSLACQLETLLINQLPNQGFHLSNVADGKHRNFGTSNMSSEGIRTSEGVTACP